MSRKKRTARHPLRSLLTCLLLLAGAWVLTCTPVGEWLQIPQLYSSSVVLPSGSRPELPAPLTDRPEQILQRRAYTVSYNAQRKQANWVAWKLDREKLVERESRTDKFLPDPDLPEAQAVTTDDYRGSGYDRGHLCPAADCRYHWRAMQESFYMTNICPQNHNLNAGDWKELEELCRTWAADADSIYIVCGPLFTKARPRKIGQRQRIPVPDAFFKAVLCTTSRPPRAIGFLFPNQAGNHPLEHYVCTVDHLEELTGMDFFTSLPDEVEQAVESSADFSQWSR